jgi:hypothetical protein
MSVTSVRSHEQAIAQVLDLTGRPKPVSEKPSLVLTVGLPASGKSTFCRALARATGAIILESDALRTSLFPSPAHTKDESRQLFEALYGAARVLLRDGVSVIIDATNLRERDRRRAYEAAEATHAGLLILRFRAPERVIAERLALRDRRLDPEDHSTAGMLVYARMAETEQPVSREHWNIDTSDAPATEAALQRAIEKLRPQGGSATGQNRGGTIT